jgi:hypothetical protein
MAERRADVSVRVSDRLYQVTNGWVALFGLAVFLLFTALVLPGQAAEAATYSGAAGSPDLSLFYSAGDLYRMAESYGQEGRRAYVVARFSFDLVFPLVFTTFLTTAVTWVYGHTFAASSLWRRANLVPPLAGVFDYLENITASVVVARYPQRTIGLEWLAPAFTLLKWSFIGASFVLLVAAGLVFAWRRGRNRP